MLQFKFRLKVVSLLYFNTFYPPLEVREIGISLKKLRELNLYDMLADCCAFSYSK